VTCSGHILHVDFRDTGMIYKYVRKETSFIHVFCDGELLYRLGFTPKDVIGKTLHDLYPSDIANSLNMCYQKAWEGQYVEYEGEINDIQYAAYLRPLFHEGKVVEVVGSCMNITERKKMERAMIQAKEEAEKANRTKSDFLSKMSHELRTPLNGILGFAQLLELDQTLNEQQHDFVQEILNGGRHLLNLINEMLDLSRIETGKLKVALDIVHFPTIVSECINIVQPLAKRKNIMINEQLDQCQNISVLADPTRLKQILLNLLDNAIKYNRVNGEIKISCHVEGKELVIHVVDTGKGFSVEEYNKVFDPFYRIDGTKEEGAGIGLSLAKQLVNVMDGRMGVTSTKGKGSDFWFSLPIHNHPLDERPFYEQNEDHAINDHDVSKYRVLYIEDNESNLHLVNKVFESKPFYTLLSARNGKEGLKMASDEKVDLILLDLTLPDINGYEVFEILKTNDQTKDIPVIALSANVMPQDIQTALDKGFKDYLIKPINVKEFLSSLSETLNKSLCDSLR
jgi:ribose transport system substrate-binding protein